MTNESPTKEISEWIENAAELESHLRDKYNKLRIWKNHWKIRSLELYIACLESLYQILSLHDVKSEGLLQLKKAARPKGRKRNRKY